MSTLSTTQEYLDNEGFRWTVRTVLHDGGLDFEVTAPGLEPRTLRPAKPATCDTPRPSVDSEEPLPMEIP